MAETIYTFSQRIKKFNLANSCFSSPLTSQEHQYILDLLKLGNIRVRLGSVLEYEVARTYEAKNKIA